MWRLLVIWKCRQRLLLPLSECWKQRGIPYEEVMTWTTDGFYRETAEKVAYRKEEGCAVVEMECSALLRQ